MNEYSMYNPMQSSYRLVLSTETALLKINYDTIKHNVLLNRLHYLYEITSTAFKWFQSYIELRDYQVCVGYSLSQCRPVTSVFSVGCQTVYHVHLRSIINFQQTQGGVSRLCYDTQVNLHCDNNVASLRQC